MTKMELTETIITDHAKRYDFLSWINGSLVTFIRIHIQVNSEIAYIIDTTSARSFRHFSGKMQQFYREHGFMEKNKLPEGLGMIHLDNALHTVKGMYPNITIAIARTLERNRASFEKVLFGFFPNASSIIERCSGGGDNSAATLFFGKK